jgi:hypothetical protein
VDWLWADFGLFMAWGQGERELESRYLYLHVYLSGVGTHKHFVKDLRS